jgi:hypothetical protein
MLKSWASVLPPVNAETCLPPSNETIWIASFIIFLSSLGLFYLKIVLFFGALVVVGVAFLKIIAPCPKRATNATTRI